MKIWNAWHIEIGILCRKCWFSYFFGI